MLTVYICTWNTGAVTFFVETIPGGSSRVVDWRPHINQEAGAVTPDQQDLIQLALGELKAHLRPNGSELLPKDRHMPGVKFVWFPSLTGQIGGMAPRLTA